ncbi:MAG: radical SAM protein, partial [Gammaproteobacteria bacterium]
MHDPEKPARNSRIKGRGAASNAEGRFESLHKQAEDDGWYREDEPTPHPLTQTSIEQAR